MAKENILDEFLISNQLKTSDNVVVYEEIYQEDELVDLINFFRDNEIYYQVEKPTKAVGDTVLLGEVQKLPIAVISVLQIDFDKIEALREAHLMKQVNNEVPNAYYLQSFSDVELLQIIKEPQKWHFNDWVFAKQLLEKRGVSYDDLAQNANIEIEKLSHKQKSLSNLALIALAIFGIPISFTGSYIALAFALPYPFFLWYGKSKDWKNDSYYTYDDKTRQIALFIFLASILAFALGFLFLAQ